MIWPKKYVEKRYKNTFSWVPIISQFLEITKTTKIKPAKIGNNKVHNVVKGYVFFSYGWVFVPGRFNHARLVKVERDNGQPTALQVGG